MLSCAIDVGLAVTPGPWRLCAHFTSRPPIFTRSVVQDPLRKK